MFGGKYSMNHVAPDILSAFGISRERHKEIMLKLNAVASIYTDYVPVIEVWLNADKFTDIEKAYGLFTLGKLFGMGALMKRAKVKVGYPEGDLEGNLLKKLYEGRTNVDKVLQNILKEGMN